MSSERFIERQFRSLYFAMLANFVIFGVTLTIIGATLPKIIHGFHWSYTATGIVLSAGAVGYFVSTFVSGILLRWVRPKHIIVAGLGVQAVGLSLFAAYPLVLLNLLLNFMIGLGQGGTEVVVNFSVVRIERSGQSRLMNFMHAAFAVGAIVGPFAVGRIIDAGLSWQMIYRLMALASVLMAGVLSFLPFSRLGRESRESDDARLAQLLRHPLLILGFLILFLYVGTELGVSSWVSEYYVNFLLTSASLGAYMVSIFWIGLLIGRLGLSGYRGHRQAELMLLLAITCTVALSIAMSIKDAWFAGIAFFVAGLGFSAIYPLVIALVGKYFRSGQSAAIGFVATGGGIGSFTFQSLMGAISDWLGIQRGFFFFIGLDFLMAVLTCAVIWQTRAIQKREREG